MGNVDEQEDIGKIKLHPFQENYTNFSCRNHIQKTYPNATDVLSDLSSTRYERNEENNIFQIV